MERLYTYVSKYSSKISVFKFMGILKIKSSLMIFNRFANLNIKIEILSVEDIMYIQQEKIKMQL